MKEKVSLFICGLLIGTILTGGFFSWYVRNSSIGSHKTILKLGHSLDTNHPVHKAMEMMGERLKELSGDTIELQIYAGGVLGSETQCLEQVAAGELAMTKTSAAAAENFEAIYSVFSMPYLFRDSQHYWKVLDGPIGKDMLGKASAKGILGLCYYDAGSRNFYTVNKPIITPDDMENMKIRVMSSATAVSMVQYLGGSPTPTAWGELYTALAQGTVVGAENNLPSYTSNKHYEVCKHFSMNEHARIPDIIWISSKVWNSLSADAQQWLKTAADESSKYQQELWKTMTEESLVKAKEEGVTFYEVDQKLFADKVKPMYDAITNNAIKKLIADIREVK